MRLALRAQLLELELRVSRISRWISASVGARAALQRAAGAPRAARSSRRGSPPSAMRRASAPRIERTTCRLLGMPSLREAGAVALPLGHFGQLRADQVGQRQVFEEDPHELFLGEAEDEVVLALAAVAGLRAAAGAAAAALRPLDAVALEVLLVARMHVLAVAALAVAEHGLGHVALAAA